MVKLYKDFFTDKDVLFVGYSSRNIGYSKEVYKAFSNNQMKVYPFNIKKNTTSVNKVYNNFEELPVIPKSAFILLSKENTTKAVKDLISKGIKKILFYREGNVDPEVLAQCEKAGVETAYGCPVMIYGGGFHKFHAWIAGVK